MYPSKSALSPRAVCDQVMSPASWSPPRWFTLTLIDQKRHKGSPECDDVDSSEPSTRGQGKVEVAPNRYGSQVTTKVISDVLTVQRAKEGGVKTC